MKVNRIPARLLFPSMLVFDISIDLSITGIKAALDSLSHNPMAPKPDLLMCAPENKFYALELLRGFQPDSSYPKLKLWVRQDFHADTWCIGSWQGPTFFTGSVSEHQEVFSG